LSPSAYSPMPSMFEAAATAAALMERTPFAIDDARDDDDESDDETEGEEDDVMDEVGVDDQVSCLKSKLIAI
jgi:TBC1 domain family member 8/9